MSVLWNTCDAHLASAHAVSAERLRPFGTGFGKPATQRTRT